MSRKPTNAQLQSALEALQGKHQERLHDMCRLENSFGKLKRERDHYKAEAQNFRQLAVEAEDGRIAARGKHGDTIIASQVAIGSLLEIMRAKPPHVSVNAIPFIKGFEEFPI